MRSNLQIVAETWGILQQKREGINPINSQVFFYFRTQINIMWRPNTLSKLSITPKVSKNVLEIKHRNFINNTITSTICYIIHAVKKASDRNDVDMFPLPLQFTVIIWTD